MTLPDSTSPPLDAATLRRLSVEAEVDPRTILRVLKGLPVRGLPRYRARRVLLGAGFLQPEAKP
ncbi:MAG: hypothetical protein HZB56_07860 [Deltaproteobacteria bacterium]|nr:hypothetical protein [Deltaproteobacteria bacterium]